MAADRRWLQREQWSVSDGVTWVAPPPITRALGGNPWLPPLPVTEPAIA